MRPPPRLPATDGGIGAGRGRGDADSGERREAGVSRMTGIPIDLKFRLTQVSYRSFQLWHPDDSRSSGVTNRAPTTHGGQLMWAARMRLVISKIPSAKISPIR